MEEIFWSRAERWIMRAVRELNITSADAYYRWLREVGEYAPRRIVRDVWRQFMHAERYVQNILDLSPFAIIPRSWHAETESEYIEKYAYRIKGTFLDPETGETVEQHILIKSDMPYSRGEVEDIFSETLIDYFGDERVSEIAITDIKAYHRRGAGW